MDWEAYFRAALEEFEDFRSGVTDPAWRNFLFSKVGSDILMAIAQCDPPNGLTKWVTEAAVLAKLEERCRAKAKVKKEVEQ